MIAQTLQQWLPAVVLVALHRVSHPDVAIPLWRALWRMLKREKPALTEVIHITPHVAIVPHDLQVVTPEPVAVAAPAPLQHALTDSTHKESSMIDLTKIATAMGQAACALSASKTFGEQLYSFGAGAIAAVEKAYEGAPGTGRLKKAGVLAAVTVLAKELEGDGSTFAAEFEPWLESVVGMYNAVRAVQSPEAVPVTPQGVELGALSVGLRAEAAAESVIKDVTAVGQTVKSIFTGGANQSGV